MPTAQQIAERFGPRVRDIVVGCSDSVAEDPTQGAARSIVAERVRTVDEIGPLADV